jgi:hypothetical protein
MKTKDVDTIQSATAPADGHPAYLPFIAVTPGLGPIPPVPATATTASLGGLHRVLIRLVTRVRPGARAT